MRKILLPLALATLAAPAAMAFTIESTQVPADAQIGDAQVFDGFGCTGGNVSPELTWSDAPEGTQSFALIMFDPDAPTGVGGFTHWIVYNIPADATSLPEGAGAQDGAALPAGAKMAGNSYGFGGYGGPCPPEGDTPHRYQFTLYAIGKAALEIPDGATSAVAGFFINAYSVKDADGKPATAYLEGTFGR